MKKEKDWKYFKGSRDEIKKSRGDRYFVPKRSISWTVLVERLSGVRTLKRCCLLGIGCSVSPVVTKEIDLVSCTAKILVALVAK